MRYSVPVWFAARARSRLVRRSRRVQGAFTLFELVLAVAILAAVAAAAVPGYQSYRDRADIARAMTDIRVIEGAIERYNVSNNGFPDTLAQVGLGAMRDPWGHPYQYLNIASAKNQGAVRKDHKLVPLNSDYDLYSMGKDGESRPPLTSRSSRDDIIRANNGAFLGLASDY
jgi:general secretion pathway protein G